MACDSCLVLVEEELTKLGVKVVRVELGEVEIDGLISDEKKKTFAEAIKRGGLELVETPEEVLIDKIKGFIGDYIQDKKKINRNLSDYLAEKLSMDYNQLSSYFSTLTGTTIEQYGISRKIEKAKEMLTLEDKTLKEIAEELDYKQVSHLSNQFKKATGQTPSEFKKQAQAKRKTIQELGRVG